MLRSSVRVCGRHYSSALSSLAMRRFAVPTASGAMATVSTTMGQNGGLMVTVRRWKTEKAAEAVAETTAEQPKEAEASTLSPEELELQKDQEALKYTIMGIITVIASAMALWYGNKLGSERYVGDKESVKVAVETRGRPALGGPFTLVTTDGEPVSQAKFLGKWTFFYFGFVHCPEICPIELNRMTKVVNAVHDKRPDTPIVPLFVSCDPKRDSLMAIKEYLSVFHKDFIGLVGTPAQVADTCKSYRIYYSVPDQEAEDSGDYIIDHSIAIFLFDPQGRFVDFFGNRYTEQDITEKVLGYIDKYDANPEWTNY